MLQLHKGEQAASRDAQPGTHSFGCVHSSTTVHFGGRGLRSENVERMVMNGMRVLGDVLFVFLIALAAILTAVNVKHKIDALRLSWKSTIPEVPAAAFSPVSTIPVIEECTPTQLDAIEKQLPSEECVMYKEKPYLYGGQCSFSYATRCPEPKWLFRYYQQAKSSHRRQAIFVGSDKGRDVVSALRLLTMNSDYSKETWNTAYYQGKTADGEMCKTRLGSTPVVEAKTSLVDVFCIEPSKQTAEQITQTSRTVHYEENLHVFNMEITSSDQPSSEAPEVPRYTLDTFVKKYVNNSDPIEILSINVDGQDPVILSGADESLTRVHYLDFTYTWRGSWSEYTLFSVVDQLQEKGFVCYWAGTGGNLWRITECWLRHYDVRVWSHVACVKQSHNELLHSMEESFRKTLQIGSRIKYDDKKMAETDGRSQ